MTPTLTRWLVAATATGALAANAFMLTGSAGYGQEKADAPARAEPVSTIHCLQCHALRSGPGYEAYKKQKRTDFIRLDEYLVWQDDDLHSTALANIKPDPTGGPGGQGNLAWVMQDILSKSPSRKGIADYRVDRADECLACHAVDTKPGAVTAGQMNPGRFHADAGVGCEACHGLVTPEWIGLHIEGWRERTPVEKAKYHQVDLRDPYTRALTCAGCHVGNKAEGKFVTHEMYAAGHPPLPPFEVVTFAHEAPPHYHAHRENVYLKGLASDEKTRDAAWARFHYRLPADRDHPDGVCPQARDLALGTVAAFEATMGHLAKDAADTAATKELLDFAHFDCYACHHDLEYPSWRQQRGYRGVPGRPTMKPWATESLQVVLKHGESAPGPDRGTVAGLTPPVLTKLKELNDAFNARPFGDPETIQKAAAELAAACRQLRPEMDKVTYSAAETKRFYEAMAGRLTALRSQKVPGPDGLYLDHDAAQQFAWALAVLQDALRAAQDAGPSPELGAARDRLGMLVGMKLRVEPRQPIAPRVNDRQKEIRQFRPGRFLDATEGMLKAFDGK